MGSLPGCMVTAARMDASSRSSVTCMMASSVLWSREAFEAEVSSWVTCFVDMVVFSGIVIWLTRVLILCRISRLAW